MAEPLAPTPREMDILKVLWTHGPSSVRDVFDKICCKETLAYNTVQTMLRIMEDKGLVKHHVEGRAFIYTPIHTREESASGFLDNVFNGAVDELVMALVRAERLSARELEQMQQMIDEARGS